MLGVKYKTQKTINNLRYADDPVLITRNEKDLQNLLNVVKNGGRKKGLDLNNKKIELMVSNQRTTIMQHFY